MDVFQRMQEAAKERQEGEKQLAFQERIVKQILRHSGVQIPVGRMQNEAFEKYGDRALNFFWFNQEFPTFPVYLMAEKLKHTHKATLAQLYGKGQFRKLNWWKEYEEQAANNAIDLKNERAVLFFNLPHAKEAFLMTLHNQPTQNTHLVDAELRDDAYPRTVFPMKSGVTAVLEAFPSFLDTVGTDWVDLHAWS